MTIQTDEFYQLELYQPNFEGPNGTWGGLFSGGRYSWEQPTDYKSEVGPVPPRLFKPLELITEVGPTPPRWGNAHENVPCWAPAHGLGDRPSCTVPDGGLTSLMLVAAVASLALVRRLK